MPIKQNNKIHPTFMFYLSKSSNKSPGDNNGTNVDDLLFGALNCLTPYAIAISYTLLHRVCASRFPIFFMPFRVHSVLPRVRYTENSVALPSILGIQLDIS